MKRFGLIGDPIGSSLSPALFRAAYGGKYSYDLIEGSDFIRSFALFADAYDGINVTAPFKEKAFLKADAADRTCAAIHAANLLVKTSEGIKAYNTDYIGVMACILDGVIGTACTEGLCGTIAVDVLQEISCSIKSGTFPDKARLTDTREAVRSIYGYRPSAMIAGCGGAGKAAAAAAADMGFVTTVLNRSMSKAEGLAESMQERDIRPGSLDLFCETFTRSDITIYTIPGYIDAIGELALAGDTRHRPRIILEANYRDPSFSPQVLSSLPGDTHYISGKEWLLYQASGGYGIFTGETPDMEAMSLAAGLS